MSKRTRTRRPTTATPRQDKRPPRFFWESTQYAWRAINPFNPTGPARFEKVGRGFTYVKADQP